MKPSGHVWRTWRSIASGALRLAHTESLAWGAQGQALVGELVGPYDMLELQPQVVNVLGQRLRD